MKLERYCLNEFYSYFGLSYSDTHIEKLDECSELKRSSEKYGRFCNSWINILKDREYESAATIYAVIPAALAASGLENLTDVDEQVAIYVNEFISTWPFSNAPFSLNHIAQDVRQKQLFQKVKLHGNTLDLGAGDGNASNFIFKPNKISVGSDPLLYSTLAAKQHNRYDMQVCLDMTKVPFKDESFDTIVMVHSIDHIKDRYDALREAARLLRDGGILALTDATQHVQELLPLAQVWEAVGMPEQAAGAFNRVLDIGGERTEFFSKEYYVEHLTELGFEEISFEYFTSNQLARKIYFHLETQFALGYFEGVIRKDKKLRDFFFEQAKKIVVPLLSKDKELCNDGKTMDMFIMARKKGKSSTAAECLSNRYRCPACGTPLKTIDCDYCSREYPVIEGIPLLIPFYADAWKKVKGKIF